MQKQALEFYEYLETGWSSAPIKTLHWIPELVCVLKKLVSQVPLTDCIFLRFPQRAANRNAGDRGVL